MRTRLTTWTEWYEFARDQLEYGESEASAYANVRSIEEVNLGRLAAADEPLRRARGDREGPSPAA